MKKAAPPLAVHTLWLRIPRGLLESSLMPAARSALRVFVRSAGDDR
jgi:hypothetical protein